MYNDSLDSSQKCGLCNHDVPPGSLCGACTKTHNTFPTLRTWSFVSDLLNQNPDPAIEYEIYAGTVGPEAATEFIGYLKMFRQLPSVDAIILDPAHAPIPDDPSVTYTLARSLARSASEDNFESICVYLERIPDQEFAVLTVQDSIRRNKKITTTNAFRKWAVKNSSVVLK